jgi:hypothetical protein
MSVPSPDAPIRASIAAGVAVAAGIANIAKIAKTQYKSSTPPTNTSPSTGGLSSTPSYNLFGGGNNMNTVNASNQPINVNNQVMVKAYVSETDVTNTQERVARYKNSAEL